MTKIVLIFLSPAFQIFPRVSEIFLRFWFRNRQPARLNYARSKRLTPWGWNQCFKIFLPRTWLTLFFKLKAEYLSNLSAKLAPRCDYVGYLKFFYTTLDGKKPYIKIIVKFISQFGILPVVSLRPRMKKSTERIHAASHTWMSKISCEIPQAYSIQ